MSASPENILELAFHLYKNSKNPHNREAELRVVIGRAYYSVFYVAKDFAGVSSPTRTHSLVLEFFEKRKNKEVYLEIYEIIKKLRDGRLEADYDLQADIEESFAEDSCLSSQEALKLLGELKSKQSS
ncbi:MAG: hypothetical protein K0U66_03125 [Gammaproteobacteria bacterium]|nr:hypothetical protein [Gammaproteobacteria bacterium]